MHLYKRVIVLVFLCFSEVLFCQLRLPSFFGDNMVLQQKDKVAIWGNDEPNTSIVVIGSWGKDASTKTDNEGKWKLKIETPEAGGPYFLTITGTKKIQFKNVLIGEVWFCSGQSNMNMPVRGYSNQPIQNSNEEILNSTNSSIRLFNVERNASLTPLTDVNGYWAVSKPSETRNFSAVAYFFAKKMNAVLDVPIGIIHSSWGGSKIQAWMDEETVSQFDFLTIPDHIPEEIKKKRQSPTLVFNGMIAPIIGYTMKGVLWYQGESNRSKPKEYKKMFPAMINSWRQNWSQGDFPFYFVQIAPYEYRKKTNAAFLREAQMHTMLEVPNTGMVVTLDIGDCNSVHPKEKKAIGDRLAYWALSKDYSISGISYSGPVYEKMENTEDAKIKLFFDYAKYGLYAFDRQLTGFEVAGANKVFYPAEAIINEDKTVSVWSDAVEKPVAVRYAFGNCITGTLFNTAGLPASSFRTDDW
ncbi:sialate O-acetylesterase [Aquimarina pacifica]|uniref:sialate O-acetylesterase n=1 Tax=Aquimarina pacifica TaxID=1296415 RepID=UPI00047262BB|nr:sialate O-acetylesterase [Aquimarina pacifica]